MRVSIHVAGGRAALALVGTLALLGAGCGLDKTEPPAVQGPSETGVSVQLTALPDVVNADGVSQSSIQLVLREPDGTPLGGHAVLFGLDGDGTLVPAASSTYVGPIQTGIVMATDRDGVANVVYVAGTAYRTVTVYVRPYGTDYTRAFYRTIEITQQ
jgi:hypothetical protein